MESNEIMVLTVEQKKLIKEVSKLQKELFSKAHNNTFAIAKKCSLLRDSGLKVTDIADLTEFKKAYISQMITVVKLFENVYDDYPTFTINHFVPLITVVDKIEFEMITDDMTTADIKKYVSSLKDDNVEKICDKSTDETDETDETTANSLDNQTKKIEATTIQELNELLDEYKINPDRIINYVIEYI